jgi:hypothetical protein
MITSQVLTNQSNPGRADPFIILLKGFYKPVPVGDGPADNLGLGHMVSLGHYPPRG